MIITILSDSHDHIDKLSRALQLIKQHRSEAVIHCGDFCAPFTAGILATINLPIYACFGNNDEDQSAIATKLKATQLIPLAEEFAEIELAGKKIAFCHYPKLGELLSKTGDYSAVFHGHTHDAYQKQVGQTLLANPGPVCGIVAAKPGQASLGIYDTQTNKFTHVQI